MDINTVTTVYEITFEQEELISILYATIDSMKDEFPDIWELMRKDGTSFIIGVREAKEPAYY